jgi:hypothetical protein
MGIFAEMPSKVKYRNLQSGDIAFGIFMSRSIGEDETLRHFMSL